jgi:hypothetical protein
LSNKARTAREKLSAMICKKVPPSVSIYRCGARTSAERGRRAEKYPSDVIAFTLNAGIEA